MSSIYGRKFAEQFDGNEGLKAAMKTWAAATWSFDDALMEAAFRKCIDRRDQWPPSLPEFMALLNEPPKNPAHEMYKSLPKPVASKESAERGIAALRNALSK